MTDLSSILMNSTLQAFVFSPLMGCLFAVLFSGVSKPPKPVVVHTVRETRRVYVEKHYYRQSSNNSGGEGGILIFAGVAFVFTIWQYAVHAQIIQQTLIMMLMTALYFALISSIIAYWRGHFTSKGWVVSLVIPTCVLAVSLSLALKAQSSFPLELTEKARQYQFFQFYMNELNDYGRHYMMTHVLGIICLFSLSLVSIFTLLHYLSLMNQRDENTDSTVWDFFIRISDWASGGAGAVLMLMLLISAYLLLEGYVIDWILI